ncbi:O-succinylbenzoic acid--CoA ligase [Williamsia sterculiae]|uniref:O-succinylbenzoic acid--CoA ligase n=1 Tax=Williamsia sterculiae TaxID=1344003 RepID=A0A1N7CYR8_9NOCA|nr:o-succinylbenzoate--CoA ligase [Williamsia sterculiae]SIR68733.1 O-succinylbenzoic acid--CoA ligase [Williamsia sterculiae]
MLDALDFLAEAVVGVADGSDAHLPVPADDAGETRRLADAMAVDTDIDPDIAMVVSTSGTTGTPKGAQLTSTALRASATATHRHLGGPGGWLLALPGHHIAGLQVLLRSIASGYEPVVIDVSVGFDPDDLVTGLERMGAPRRYTSLVPTQLIKVLDHPRATAALAETDGVLVGGAATPVALRERAIATGIPIVRTYGMSETCGGSVYDGIPLDGVDVTILSPDADGVGRVSLGGAVVASGYRNLPDHAAFADPGRFRTDDLGRLDDGVLTVVGRADEAISTGGLTVVPQVVEAAILSDPAVADCAVVGLPDARLGARVVAAVVAAAGGEPSTESVRATVTDRLGGLAAPREVLVVSELPRRGPGKVDRRALVAQWAGYSQPFR